MSKPVCLIICSGKDCRRDKGFDELLELASSTGRAQQVPCQGLCDGPIVAIRRDDHLRWFSHVRSKSMRTSVGATLRSGKIDKHLRQHEVKKRRDVIRAAGRLRSIA